MFRVRIFTPPALSAEGHPQAGGELCLGAERRCFLVDLGFWGVADYQRQWREGTARLLHGAQSTALMTAYRGPAEEVTHLMWALWRHEDHVYVQEHPVSAAELHAPFDPAEPYPHVGQWIPAGRHALPIGEWRIDLVDLYAAALGIRWPLHPG